MNTYQSWVVTPFKTSSVHAGPVAITLGVKLLCGIVCGHAGYTPIGMIRQSLSFGLLCVGPDGQYVRVNGSYVEKLDFQLITQTLERLQSRTETVRTVETSASSRAAIKVTVRRRWTAAMAEGRTERAGF
jgi:hypothetical protein